MSKHELIETAEKWEQVLWQKGLCVGIIKANYWLCVKDMSVRLKARDFSKASISTHRYFITGVFFTYSSSLFKSNQPTSLYESYISLALTLFFRRVGLDKVSVVALQADCWWNKNSASCKRQNRMRHDYTAVLRGNRYSMSAVTAVWETLWNWLT